MKYRLKYKFIFCSFFIFQSFLLLADNASNNPNSKNKDWLKIYYSSEGINRIMAEPTNEIDSLYYTLTEFNDSVYDRETDEIYENNEALIPTETRKSKSVLLNIASKGDIFSILADSIKSMILGSNIPTVYITTDPYVDEIKSKVNYLDAEFKYIPYGDGTDTIINNVSIRGRGNTSWFFPKKPYRLKFDKKQKIGSLNKAKSFVLLSNYIDNTLMKNAIAFKIAEMLEMPYTNIPMPVNLVFNGNYRGSYLLTNKVGINSGSIDINEEKGILWELDTNYDEDYKFTSSINGLPCMLKDPDFGEIYEDDPQKIEEAWEGWVNDLETAFQGIEDGNWIDFFDAEQFVKYILVTDIVQNGDIAFPKSTYLYKADKASKYILGPVWDFDWAFGYNYKIHYALMNSNSTTYKAFHKIFEDELFLSMFEKELNNFCENHLEDLMKFIDDYAVLISDSTMQDFSRWPADHYNNFETVERHTGNFHQNVDILKDWLLNRIDIIKNSKTFSIYEIW